MESIQDLITLPRNIPIFSYTEGWSELLRHDHNGKLRSKNMISIDDMSSNAEMTHMFRAIKQGIGVYIDIETRISYLITNCRPGLRYARLDQIEPIRQSLGISDSIDPKLRYQIDRAVIQLNRMITALIKKYEQHRPAKKELCYEDAAMIADVGDDKYLVLSLVTLRMCFAMLAAGLVAGALLLSMELSCPKVFDFM